MRKLLVTLLIAVWGFECYVIAFADEGIIGPGGTETYHSSPAVSNSNSIFDNRLVIGILIGMLIGTIREIQRLLSSLISFILPGRRRW